MCLALNFSNSTRTNRQVRIDLYRAIYDDEKLEIFGAINSQMPMIYRFPYEVFFFFCYLIKLKYTCFFFIICLSR